MLVAEDFEELMIVTCRLRDEDSAVDWYLIQAQANSHNELSFHHVVGPAIDIQTERKADAGESEFWAPIRRSEFGELFAGKPVSVRDDGWIAKQIRGVEISLNFRKNYSYVYLNFRTENRVGRRDEVVALFPEADYEYNYHESAKSVGVRFPVINKGKDHPEDWDEIREKLVAMGTNIYNKINESGL